ncbi:Xylose isomerase domain protein TIM barrel [uncultured Desulfobacterium sp.]|uniref:Xylose isomerase domain protein TIM barrel n=1 Tax=uncultured Desulfobacterium sp. TaxID=201089 RepID=A0A445N0U3_9BACT|nr:Xylose isomerase domain protein TIM barrel [uncultured Desulfobacterium sp.]
MIDTKKIRYAFSSNAFRKYSLTDTIKILSDIGYDGIEIMADTPHAYPPELSEMDIADIRDALSRQEMEISNINAFMLHAVGDTWHPSWIEKDPALRKIRINHTLNCIDLADKLGAPTISIEPGGPLDGISTEEGITLFLEGLSVIKERARESGVRVLIEPEPGLLIENSSQFMDLFNELNPNVFGLNFDVGHFFCVGEDPSILIMDMRDVIGHFHLEDIAASRIHRHLMPGHGVIDMKSVLNSIQEINYSGMVTVELYPYENHPVEAAEQALKYLLVL